MDLKQLVSVVTPSFNQAQFIEETLRSVELQEHRPIHQIVIDGGSTDGTVSLLKRWAAAEHDPGYTFEWISEPDRGHADALNKGFDRVRGEFVGWLNSDDVYFDRQVVSSAVAAFKKHPDVDVVHGEVALITENSGLQMIWCMPQFSYERVLRGYIIPQPTVLFRRCVTDKHRLDPAARVAIDQIYWLQIGREHKFLKIHRVQAADRDHASRISRVSTIQLLETTKIACAAFGAKGKPGVAATIQDVALRALLRFKGFFYLLALLNQKELPDNLAFPVWVDSFSSAIKRQFSMRINRRIDMGSRPTSVPHQFKVGD